MPQQHPSQQAHEGTGVPQQSCPTHSFILCSRFLCEEGLESPTIKSDSMVRKHYETHWVPAEACPETCPIWPETSSKGLSQLHGLSGLPRAEAPE